MAEDPPFRYVPPADPNIGRRFGRYVVRTLLGRGGMGAAYLAEHEAQAHVRCVIKFVLAELAQNPVVISRYKTETDAVSLLRHDNIVRLQDFGVLEDNGQLFMCFEYIDGQSLDRYVAERGGRLDIRKAAYFIFQLCDALQYAHECGVVHRDLKPDNIIIEISPPGCHLEERVKILDFGIAKVANTTHHTGSGVSMGTPRYMAPEQVTNAAAATSAADVFSLATIFYHLVTGTLPWGMPESDVAIYYLQKTEAPVRPPESVMPSDAVEVIIRALSIKPALRPSIREFAVEIAASIPREDDLESGTEILKHVKRSWVTSSLPHVQTLPRPVVPDPTINPAFSDVPRAAVVPGRDTPDAEPLQRPSITDLVITARVRGRRPVAPEQARGSENRVAAVDVASAPGQAAAAISAGGPSPGRIASAPVPLLAALPTGLLSDRFAAPEPPLEAPAARTETVIAASEIVLASRTPGPRPFAHAELPAVLVSNTQLSAAPADVSHAGSEKPHPSEAPPCVVVPDAAQRRPSLARRRSRLLLLAFLVGALAAVGIVLVTQPTARHAGDAPRSEAAGATDDRSRANAVAQASVERAEQAASATRSANAALPAESAPAIHPAPPRDSVAAPVASTPRVDVGAVAREQSNANSAAGRPSVRPKDPAITGLPASSPSSPLPPGEQRPSSSPQPAAVKKGELVIAVTSWAVIWLNGKQDEAPYRAQLPAGRYRLRMQHEDKDETTTVLVRPNETTTVTRDW